MVKTWQKQRTETLVEKYGKELRSVIFLDPQSKEVEFILYGQPDWAVILPITRDGFVVTLLQYYQGADRILRVLPGGNIEPGEASEVAAARELEEETGYHLLKVISLGLPIWVSARNSWTRFHLFLGLDCQKVGDGKGDFGDSEIELMPLKEWIKLTRTEIEEGPAVIATFRALPHLQKFLPNS